MFPQATSSWRGIKKPLSLATTRKQKKTLWTRRRKWQAKVQANKTEKPQRKKCLGRLTHYTEEEMNAFKDDMSSENTKKSTNTSVRRLQSCKTQAKNTSRAHYGRTVMVSEDIFSAASMSSSSWQLWYWEFWRSCRHAVSKEKGCKEERPRK